ncbi:MAG: hypothetical protein E6519_15715 [Clostridium sp.]|nr:hypothetical protein [Clostridium sp.]
MKFNLEQSKLLYEVRYKVPGDKESYTYEMLYRNKDGKYFMHFEGGKYSEYAVKIGMHDYKPRSGNYFIDRGDIGVWKVVSQKMQEERPNKYMIIDWEKEEQERILEEKKQNDDFIMEISRLSEAELPF